MAEIKTRDVVKGTIKSIDRVATATERVKSVSTKTKDKAEQGYYTGENSSTEYAMNQVSHAAKSVTDKGVQQFWKQVGSQTTTPKISIRNIKTRRVVAKKIKQPVRGIGKISKTTAKRTVNTTKKGIKTAHKTSKAAIKTTEKAAQAAAKTSIKTTQRAMQVAKMAAKATMTTIKVSVKLTIATIKALIAATKALAAAIIAGGWIAILIILIIVLFGGLLSIFGGSGGRSNSYTTVSAEVVAYEPLIQQYAKTHGIVEYTELIKAVMMQESGGRGTDPMQAAECGFNTQYPNEPNGITDPEYSINVGIQNLAECLMMAEVETPVDMERIKLALQGYNFGNGYISWAKTEYGSYSFANAMEFSEMMAEQSGWSSYGDTQYVSNVLRYYPFGRAFLAEGNTVMVEIALSQLGNKGGQLYWSWYGFTEHVEWCACFVSWCAEQAGYIVAGIIPKFAECQEGIAWFKEREQWQDKYYTPSAGDIIFFDWEEDEISDHVGIVERVENGMVYTIEGNYNDVCGRASYVIGSSVICGYGVPIY